MWIEYADLDGFRVDTYNYSDPTGILDKSNHRRIPPILWAKSGCKAKHKWRIGKKSKIGAIKTTILPAECYGFYVIRYWHRFQ
jgi:hypothetical protein